MKSNYLRAQRSEPDGRVIVTFCNQGLKQLWRVAEHAFFNNPSTSEEISDVNQFQNGNLSQLSLV